MTKKLSFELVLGMQEITVSNLGIIFEFITVCYCFLLFNTALQAKKLAINSFRPKPSDNKTAA